VASRCSPRTCTICGSSETSSDASGELKLQWPAIMRASIGRSGAPILNSPLPSATGAGVSMPDGSGSRLDIATP
jgi:hypothetical protein